MVLECVLADTIKDGTGNPILSPNGIPQMENYQFKFKNTYRNDKEVIIDAGE